jgi:hypothetical protein
MYLHAGRAYARAMRCVVWLLVAVASIVGFVVGTVVVGSGDRAGTLGGTVAGPCTRFPDGGRFLDQALVPWRELSFASPYVLPDLRGPLNGLTLVRAEVEGPGFEGRGQVGIWVMPQAVPPGWLGGAILYSVNPVARRVEGRSIYAGKLLRRFKHHGEEAVYDPRVIRAIAPTLAASCVEGS